MTYNEDGTITMTIEDYILNAQYRQEYNPETGIPIYVRAFPFTSWVYGDSGHPMVENPYFVHTAEFQENFAEWIRINYGRLEIRPSIMAPVQAIPPQYAQQAIELVAQQIRAIFDNNYAVNEYEYRGLYKTTQFVYNPIWNVDGTETETITESNSSSHSESIGSQINSGSSSSNSQGSASDTNRVATDRSGSAYANKDQISSSESNNVTSSHNETIGARNDGGRYSESKSYSRELVKGGNIGVTMTQQLIEAERKVLNFSMYKVIAEDIVKYISYMIYGEV